jgi:hypothetical protein
LTQIDILLVEISAAPAGRNMHPFSVLKLLGALLLPMLALAQSTTGTLTGNVIDGTGASVAGAKVEAINKATQNAMTALTSETGTFTLPSLMPGTYQVRVSMAGFKASVADNVEVRTAQIATRNMTLELGELTETISVTAESPLINPNSAAVTNTIANKIMQDLPFPDRSMLSAVMLTPGVQGDPQYNSGVQSELPGIFTQAVSPGVSISIGGGRPGGGSVLVDGSDVTASGIARAIMTFSADTVQEVSVQAVGIPAQYGRTTSGIINQTTRSGSNEFHGIGTWSHMDPYLQTKALGSAFEPTARYDQASLALGGPVYIPKIYDGRNKTFFWASGEPQRQKMLFGASRSRLPTAEELRGNFSNSWDFLDPTLRQQNVDAAIASGIRTNNLRWRYERNAAGFPIGDELPIAQRPIIENNDLSGLLARNAIAQAVIKTVYPFTPGVNTPYMSWLRPDGLWDIDGTNVIFARGVQTEDNRWSVKVDHLFGSNDRIAARYSVAPVQGTRFDWGGPSDPSNPIPQDKITSRNASLSFNHIFSSSLINEFRATYSRGNALRSGNDAGFSQDWGAAFGLTPAVLNQGFPRILGRGFDGGGELVGRTIDVNAGFGNDLSWIRGRHSIKMGGEHRRIQLNRLATDGLTGGSYNFSGQITPNQGSIAGTINELGGLITGSLNSYTFKRAQTNSYYRWRYYALYVQDDFKATSKLTLNVGLRWDVETPRVEKYDRQGFFDPFLQGSVNGQPVTGAFVFSNTQGYGRGLWPTNFTGFQPRIGLAYALTSKVVWRASYSILRAPITGIGNSIHPDLNINAGVVNSAQRTGGVNPGPVNYITNPVASLPPAQELSRDPIFFMNDSNSFDFYYIPQDRNMPYVQRWNGGTQVQVSPSMSFEIGYDGSKGTHLYENPYPFNFAHFDTTAPLVAAGADFGTRSVAYNRLGIANSNGQVITGNLLESLRPYPQFFNRLIQTGFSRASNSTYHALITGLQRRFGNGLTIQGTYTWSKSIDDAGFGTGADVFGRVNRQDIRRSNERGLSTYDIPHKFNLAYSYELPFGRGRTFGTGAGPWLNRLIGGWVTAGFVRVSSGYPAVAYLGSDGWFVSRGGGDGLDGFTLRPDRVPGAKGVNATWREDPFRRGYYNPDSFAVPGSEAAPRLGTSGGTLPDVRSPGTSSWDASMMKNINLSNDGRAYVQLRVDVLNVPNHPNFFINPNNRNSGLFSFNAAQRTFNQNVNFTPIDPNNTAQFNNYAGRAFRLGARVYF